MAMDDQASKIEKMMKPVTEQELQELGGTSDANGVWTFRDGSRGKISEKPVAVYSDDHRTELIGLSYFDRVERLQ
jgi:hypothetical protein